MRPTAASPRRTALLTPLVALALAATTLTACGSGSGSDPDTVKISFKQSTDNSIKVMDTYLADIKKQFEQQYPGKKVELVPIKAPDSEYYTKLQQMLRSPKTAPDLVYEDTFLINSDITSGYLKPLDPYLDKWPDWNQFVDTAKSAAKAEDGRRTASRTARTPEASGSTRGSSRRRACPRIGSRRTGTTSSPRPARSSRRSPASPPSTSTPASPPAKPPPCRASRCCSTAPTAVPRTPFTTGRRRSGSPGARVSRTPSPSSTRCTRTSSARRLGRPRPQHPDLRGR